MSFRNASWAQDPRKDNDFEALLRGGSSVLIPRVSAVTPPISTAAARPGVAARTDDDLTDELAWQARGTMAAASRARTELAAATRTRENKELLQQRLAQGAKVDDDMTDEAAWHETRWGRVLRKSSSQPSALYVGVTSSQAGDLYVGVVRTSSASGGWYARNRPVE